MSINYWFNHTIDCFLEACAEGRSAQEAVTAAEAATATGELRVLTQPDLRAKGIKYSRQHLTRLIDAGLFPRPFHMPTALPERDDKGWPKTKGAKGTEAIP
jgi:hypothetical protein